MDNVNDTYDRCCYRCEDILTNRHLLSLEKFILTLDVLSSVVNRPSQRGWNCNHRFFKQQRCLFLREFKKRVSALQNSGGGVLLVHITDLDPSDRSLNSFHEIVDQHLHGMTADTSLFGSMYQINWFQDDDVDCQGYVAVTVQPSDRFVTLDFKTKESLDDCIVDPKQMSVVTLLAGQIENTTPNIRGMKSAFHKSRNIQVKAVFDNDLSVSDLVDYIWDALRLPMYITAFSKVTGGGSLFVGVLEKQKEYSTYMSKKLIAEGFHCIRSRHADLINILKNKVNNDITILSNSFEGNLIEVAFHEIDRERDLYVMEVAVASVDGVVFYDKQGPEAYELDDEGKLCRIDRYTWLERVIDCRRSTEPDTIKHTRFFRPESTGGFIRNDNDCQNVSVIYDRTEPQLVNLKRFQSSSGNPSLKKSNTQPSVPTDLHRSQTSESPKVTDPQNDTNSSLGSTRTKEGHLEPSGLADQCKPRETGFGQERKYRKDSEKNVNLNKEPSPNVTDPVERAGKETPGLTIICGSKTHESGLQDETLSLPTSDYLNNNESNAHANGGTITEYHRTSDGTDDLTDSCLPRNHGDQKWETSQSSGQASLSSSAPNSLNGPEEIGPGASDKQGLDDQQEDPGLGNRSDQGLRKESHGIYYAKSPANQEMVSDLPHIVSAAMSVGLISSVLGSVGTGFRVGTRYIMTAAHVLAVALGVKLDTRSEKDITEFQLKAQQEETLQNLDLKIHFHWAKICGKKPYKFKLKSVRYLSIELDVAIIEAEGDISSLPNFSTFLDPKDAKCDFHLLGYDGAQPVQRRDYKCQTVTQLEAQEKKQEFLKNDVPKVYLDRYDIMGDCREFLHFQCSFEHGGSGSPGIKVHDYNKVSVLTMLLSGYPNLPSNITGQFEMHLCVEEGVRMWAVKEDLKKKDPELCHDIFGIYVEDGMHWSM